MESSSHSTDLLSHSAEAAGVYSRFSQKELSIPSNRLKSLDFNPAHDTSDSSAVLNPESQFYGSDVTEELWECEGRVIVELTQRAKAEAPSTRLKEVKKGQKWGEKSSSPSPSPKSTQSSTSTRPSKTQTQLRILLTWSWSYESQANWGGWIWQGVPCGKKEGWNSVCCQVPEDQGQADTATGGENLYDLCWVEWKGDQLNLSSAQWIVNWSPFSLSLKTSHQWNIWFRCNTRQRYSSPWWRERELWQCLTIMRRESIVCWSWSTYRCDTV